MEQFKFEIIENFFPDKKLNEKQLKNSIGKLKQYTLVEEKINFENFTFSGFVAADNNGIIHEVIFRLPTYFLHDSFYQSLINRFQKPSKYHLKSEQASYEWEKPYFIHYEATCTITCFPIFLLVSKTSNIQNSVLWNKITSGK